MSKKNTLCGYLEEEANLPDGIPPKKCELEVWRDHDNCIWHAQVDDKLPEALAKHWEQAPERIDGIYLCESTIGDRLDFSGKMLYSGCFSGADLTQADFSNAILDNASFDDARLQSVKFNGESTSLRGVDFSRAVCVDTRFQRATLHNSSFRSADLSSAKFQNADAAEAVLTDAQLHDGTFIHANLRSANLQGAELHQADFAMANLENAQLKGTDLRGASFIDADLLEADFRDAEANHETDFGSQLLREFLADRDDEYRRVPGVISIKDVDRKRGPKLDSDIEAPDAYCSTRQEYINERKIHHRITAGVTRLITRNPFKPKTSGLSNLKKAGKTYKNIKQLFRENPVPEQRRVYNIREKEVKRKISYIERDLSWFRWTGLRWSMKYGESPKQVMFTSLGIVLFGSLLYPFFGIHTDAHGTIRYSLSGEVSLELSTVVFFYSLRRLISPTNGNVTPLGAGEWIGLIQTTLGALLVAMLIFTLGRRATS